MNELHEMNELTSLKLCRARALYDCDADEPGDLSFVMGEVITVLAKDEQSGWWTGQFYFLNFVKLFFFLCFCF